MASKPAEESGSGGGEEAVSAAQRHSPALLSGSDWMRDAQGGEKDPAPGLTVKRGLEPRTHLYAKPEARRVSAAEEITQMRTRSGGKTGVELIFC